MGGGFGMRGNMEAGGEQRVNQPKICTYEIAVKEPVALYAH